MFTFRNTIRTYARWNHRRPSKIILPQEIKAVNELAKVDTDFFEKLKNVEMKPKLSSQQKTVNQVQQISPKTERSNITEKVTKLAENSTVREHKEKVKKKVQYKVKEEKRDKSLITDEETQLNYIKLDLDDSVLSSLMLSVKSRKRRDQTQEILLEGKRLVKDALLSDLKPNAILFSRVEHLRHLSTWLKPYNKDINSKEHIFFRVTFTDLKLWSDLVTSPGIMGLFERPPLMYTPKAEDPTNITLPLTIVCDNIREPSNMGAIIRTCAALPVHKLILTKGCCDPWDSKVLRGGAGGHFRLSLQLDVTWDDLKEQLPAKSAVFLADSNSKKVVPDVEVIEYNKSEYKKNNENIILVLGGETQSLSNEAYDFCRLRSGSRVSIPLAREVDSLNTATALSIISFEIRRQLLDK